MLNLLSQRMCATCQYYSKHYYTWSQTKDGKLVKNCFKELHSNLVMGNKLCYIL